MKSSLVKATLLRKVNIAEFSCWQESVTNNFKRNVCCQGRIEPQSSTAEATAVEHINLPSVLPSAISNVKVRVINICGAPRCRTPPQPHTLLKVLTSNLEV